MHVTEAVVSNFMKVRYIEVRPETAATFIGGKNRQGKTSFLDAIMAALGGKKACPKNPIRTGEVEAKVEVKLQGSDGIPSCKVVRHFVKLDDGGYDTTMEIIEDDENEFRSPSPQKMLDGVLSAASFDPCFWVRKTDKEIAEHLRIVLGLDFTKIDEDRAKYYATRTEVNRKVRDLEAEIRAIPLNAELPDEPIDLDDLREQYQSAVEHNSQATSLKAEVTKAAAQVERYEELLQNRHQERSDLQDRHDRLTAELNALEKQIEEKRESITKGQSVVEQAKLDLEAAEKDFTEFQGVDVEAIQSQIKTADEMNDAIHAQSARRQYIEDKAGREKRSIELTEQIEGCDEAKAKMIAEADWPIEGMSFDGNDTVTLNGVPFTQASQEEQLTASVKMGFAMQPTLKMMLVRDGAYLDEDHVELIASLAEEHEGQLFIERVGEGQECQVIIRDGELKDGDAETDQELPGLAEDRQGIQEPAGAVEQGGNESTDGTAEE